MRSALPSLLLLSLLPVAAWAAPIAIADAASTPGKTPVTLAVTANDLGGPNPATVDFATSTASPRLTTRNVGGQGTFVADDAGNVTFTPLASFSGTCSTTYFVRDAGGAASGRATIQVTVGPVANDDLVLVTYQTSRVFQPLGNDVVASGAAFNFTSLDLDPTQPGVQTQRTLAAGTLTADNAGNVTFQPVAGFVGSVPDVTYTVADNRVPPQTSNVGTIRLRVGGRPFDCSGEFYQISQTGSTAQLFRLTRNNAGGTVNYSATLLYDTGTQLNALALSGADGYLYAIGIGAGNISQVYQLSQDGVMNLGLMPGLPASGFNSATADNQGNYYLANNTTSTIYRANLRTFSATSLALSQAVQCGDIAFNPTDGFLYASRYPSDLYRIDLASANATKPATTLSAASSGGNMGSIFFDASGTLYGASNEGTFYVYDLGTGLSTAIGTANTSSQGDGASCAFPSQKIDVVKATGTVVRHGSTVFDVPFTIRVRNTSSAEAPNVQVNEFLYAAGNSAATFAGASSVAILTGPVASGDLPAASANPGFSGQGANTGLLLGGQSLQAGQTGTLTFTARVTYPAGAVPSQAFNTAYASTATRSPNAGYQLLAGGTLISPDQVLAADRSTNGGTLPATANADSPSPSPVPLGSQAPLPVSLRVFSAVAEGPAARLGWATASETNSAYFAVERAAEGGPFVELGRVAGQGSTALTTTYAYLDARAARAGTSLAYRLRQVDADGTATYSPVRTLRFGAAAPAVALYPTPAGTTATLDLTALASTPQAVTVLDLTGRVLARYTLPGGQAHALDLRGLPLGVSLVRVAGYTLRLVRQE